MKILYDPDEYETVIDSRTCTTCGGDLKKCDGGCNGMFSLGSRRRPASEVREIKAARQREAEDAILAQADAIRARRST